MSVDRFPFIQAAGSPYEIGHQVGEACEDRIRKFLDIILTVDLQFRSGSVPEALSYEEALRRTKLFLPLFEDAAPHHLDEVRGIADGARISFEEALLLQIRGEIAFAPETVSGCTAFVLSRDATTSGEIILGQNSDIGREMGEVAIVLHITPEKGPRMLMYAFAGLMGYHGINSEGIGHFANALIGPDWRMGLPHYPLKRLMLESSSLDGLLAVLKWTEVCSAGNYVLADGQGKILDVELTGEGCETVTGEEGFIVHSNHFLCERWIPTEKLLDELPDSKPRYRRIRSLVQQDYGALSVDKMKAILSDHDGYPTSICRHSSNGDITTAASMIAEPERGLMHISAGNPCEGEYHVYEV